MRVEGGNGPWSVLAPVCVGFRACIRVSARMREGQAWGPFGRVGDLGAVGLARSGLWVSTATRKVALRKETQASQLGLQRRSGKGLSAPCTFALGVIDANGALRAA